MAQLWFWTKIRTKQWLILGAGKYYDITFYDFGKKKIIFSDEADVDLGGYINKQNYRIWGTDNPHAYIEKPTHP